MSADNENEVGYPTDNDQATQHEVRNDADREGQGSGLAKKGCGCLAVLIVIGIIGAIAVAVSSPNEYIFLHNPHDGEMEVTIGEEHFSLFPDGMVYFALEDGEYQATSTLNGETLLDTTITIDKNFSKKGGLLNLSGEPYYLYSEIYGTTSIPGLGGNDDLQMVVVNGTLIMGDVKELPKTQTVVPNTWYFGLEEEFTAEIEVDSYSFSKRITKLFDGKGLVRYYTKEYGAENMIQIDDLEFSEDELNDALNEVSDEELDEVINEVIEETP